MKAMTKAIIKQCRTKSFHQALWLNSLIWIQGCTSLSDCASKTSPNDLTVVQRIFSKCSLGEESFTVKCLFSSRISLSELTQNRYLVLKRWLYQGWKTSYDISTKIRKCVIDQLDLPVLRGVFIWVASCSVSAIPFQNVLVVECKP